MHDYRLFTPAVVIWFLVINYKNITLWGCALFEKIAGIDIPNCLGFIILSSLGLFAIVCCLVLVRELTKVIFSFEVVRVFALRRRVGTAHLSSIYYPQDVDNRAKHSLSGAHHPGIKFLLAALGVSIFAVTVSQELIAADEAEFFAQRSSAVTGILESVPTGTFPVGGGEIQEVGTDGIREVGTVGIREVGAGEDREVGTGGIREVGTGETREVGTGEIREVGTGEVDGEGRPHKQQRKITLPKGIILYSQSTGFRICLKGSPEFSQLSQGQLVRVFGALKESKFGVCEFELRAAKIETLASASVIQKYAGRMKQEFLSPTVQQPQLSAAQALARGVVFGDSQFFAPDDERAMRISGLKHLTAISGTHISILLIGALTVIGKRNRRLSAIVAALIVLFLLLLIGPGASVIRAGLMALFLLLGLFLGKRTDSLPLLAVVVIIESLWQPQIAIGIGFQLSVVTTAGIVILVPYLEKAFAPLHAGKILKVLTLPLIAGTVSLPLIVRIQEEISFLGVLANILSSPVVPILTITGMISAVCIPIFPALQLLTLPVIELCSAWILSVARSVAGLEIFIATPFSVFLLNVFVLLILLILAKIFSSQKEKVQFPRRKFPSLFFPALGDGGGKGAGKFFQYCRKLFQSRKYGMLGGYFLLGICATTSVIFSSGIIGAKLSGASQGINWQIVQCDVGQGSALIVKEKDLVVLIDAGPPNSKAVQCLKNNDINRLDLLVLTHLDLDHVGGVAEILQEVLVREIWVSPNIAPIERFEYLQRVSQEKQIALRNVSAGAVYEDFLEVLSPQDRELMEDPELTNERSLVVQLQQENLRTLVLADVPLEVQNNLDPGEQDVVIVAHHGAADQSELLAAKTRPRLALISVGENDYGHPHPKALQIWGGIDSLDKGRDSAKTEQVMLGTKILTTKDCGEIKVSAQGFSAQCNDSQ